MLKIIHRLNHQPITPQTLPQSCRIILLLLCLLLLTAFQPEPTQPVTPDEAILYMAYEDTPQGIVLIVSPDGYRDLVIDQSYYGSDSSGRYQREQMIASRDGRWLAISVRDTQEDSLLWVPIIALDGSGGNTFFPPWIARAARLGSFSPDGRYLALALVGQESPASPLFGGVMVFDIASSPESDEQTMWWLPIEPRDGQVMWAEIGDWNAHGIEFLPVCYDCADLTAGEYALWEPFTGTTTPQTGRYFVPALTMLESTGEALRLEYDANFPLNAGASGANVIRYLPSVTPDTAAWTTIYADPRGIESAHWVLDGQALLVQPAGVYDLWLLIYRDGRVVEYPHALGIRFVVGSTEGWFVEGGNADGYTDITHISLSASSNLVGASGGAYVIRPPHLGTSLPDPPPPFPPLAPAS